MHLFLLALVFVLLAHDQWTGSAGDARSLDWVALGAVTLGPKLVIAAVYALACAGVRSQRGTPRGHRGWRWLKRSHPGILAVLLGLFVVDLEVGLLAVVRTWLGDGVLLDELVVLAPTLTVVLWMWWVYYPIERHARESMTIRLLDEGQPVPPVWTRGQYMLNRLRHETALVLVPMLALLAWMDSLKLLQTQAAWSLPDAAWWLLQLSGVGGIMLLAPLVIRHVWATTPLPPGPLRERLVAMCRTHRVGVRELLLWHTFGGMINAAVMGLIAPVRYILLTDALLDLMPLRQVEAVMAHELAHVRRHHLFWLMLAAMALGGMVELAALGVTGLTTSVQATISPVAPGSVADLSGASVGTQAATLFGLEHPVSSLGTMAGMVPAVAAWMLGMGWISRRFERQADTFAVQHLVREQAVGQFDTSGRLVVDAASAQVMIDALESVATLNHIDPRRRSWRHGSIAWRQDYLRTLVGRPVDELPIDRTVRRINAASVLLLGTVATLMAWLHVLDGLR